MPIAVTLPTVTADPTKLMHIIATKLAILPASGTQKDFIVKSWRYRPPVTTFLPHQEYNPTSKKLEVDRTSPLSSDGAEISLVVEGFTADFLSVFVNGATPVDCTARIWAISQKDAANTVRLLSNEFSAYADLDGEIGFEPTAWVAVTIKLTVSGAKPTWTIDASTTV